MPKKKNVNDDDDYVEPSPKPPRQRNQAKRTGTKDPKKGKGSRGRYFAPLLHVVPRRRGNRVDHGAFSYGVLNKKQKEHLITRIRRDVTTEENTPNGCERSTLSLDNSKYPKSLRLNHKLLLGTNAERLFPKNTSFRAGKVILWNMGQRPQSDSDQSSHLCDHAWCVNPEHFTWDSAQQNSSRKGCLPRSCRHRPVCFDLSRCGCEDHVGKRADAAALERRLAEEQRALQARQEEE
eukprot:TRINITY_DN1801_c0_g1_i1.p1 TRINITY_DN1801_c0_g1~~TRINITY_DN1801_c0_g1_i1.p1  ORF type:complete len:236 (-),score=31.46 TRINITY_DN1801_c0_g1_i1:39-746(-)